MHHEVKIRAIELQKEYNTYTDTIQGYWHIRVRPGAIENFDKYHAASIILTLVKYIIRAINADIQAAMEIKNIEEFVKPFVGDKAKFVSCKCDNLLSAGENYGSVMLRVDIKILNEANEEETIHCVGKTVPPNEFIQKIFNTKVSFKTEIAVYNEIVPLLNAFGREKGIDNLLGFFAKCLNSRVSLNPNSDVVDDDAVILLENLKVAGYDTLDRFNGFDLECTKLLLTDLAVMHAASIAYKLSNPESFNAKIMPHLNKDIAHESSDEFINGIIKPTVEGASRNPACLPYLSKLEEALRRMKNGPPPATVFEPFASILHTDFWTNNTMIKMVDGKPVKNIIVDFQNIQYGSPAHDIVFFLYSSVSLPVLKEGVKGLIKYYYDVLIETLKKLDCDVSKFTFEELIRECAIVMKDAEFTHLLIMLNPIFTLKDKAKALADFSETDIIVDETSRHENYYEKLQFILLDCVKNGWI